MKYILKHLGSDSAPWLADISDSMVNTTWGDAPEKAKQFTLEEANEIAAHWSPAIIQIVPVARSKAYVLRWADTESERPWLISTEGDGQFQKWGSSKGDAKRFDSEAEALEVAKFWSTGNIEVIPVERTPERGGVTTGKMGDTPGDSVHHPSHYNRHPSGVECIDVVEHMTFNVGNAVKYAWRAGLKTEDPIEDLRKAVWYLEREILRLSEEWATRGKPGRST